MESFFPTGIRQCGDEPTAQKGGIVWTMPTYFQVTQPGKGTFIFICKKKYNYFVCDAENAFNRMCPFNGTVA